MIRWRRARLTAAREESLTARTLVFEVPDWPGHLAGQHVDVRLTAPDGYTAQRSYSLATPEGVELTVEGLPDGEVSPYLVDELTVGDEIELRGPVGGWFVWRPAVTTPVLLVAGGSGIVPLMAMIRARRLAGVDPPFHLVYSLREPARRYYAAELDAPDPWLTITWVHTRLAPHRRITKDDLPGPGPDVFVCGPTGFVEAAADLLLDVGHDSARIRTERFGG
ncbi:ferredoxin reductase [Nonomuraea dietziae]|uniref:ferredoxin reductase n=1 Tax=Nonomuraea dietziae TaxID=65515 RepID=UPI0033E8655A